MEIIDPSYQIMDDISNSWLLSKLELCGRTAYKSEALITPGSSSKFINGLIKRGHESVIEHVSITIRFITDRGVTHELVRHRLCAFTQESTRYVNYNKKGMTVIRPLFFKTNSAQYSRWRTAMAFAEQSYNAMIEGGATPQEARSVLPNSLKTEIVVTANLREWRHILKLRTSKAAHPQIRQIMIPLLEELKGKLPCIFGDINVEN